MDLDKIKNFFVLNIEKFIFALVLAVSGYLFYQGMQQPNILDKIQPDRLMADANQVRAALDENHNDAIIPERIPNFSIIERTDDVLKPVDADYYKLDKTWDGVRSKGSTRRKDPILFAPLAVRAQGVITTLAMRSNTGDYFLSSLPPAEELEKVEVRKPRRRPRRSRMSMEDEMMEEDMMMDEDMMDMEYSMDPSMSGTTGPMRKFDSAYDKGHRPGTTTHFQHETPQKPVPAIGWFIAGTAVVPHKDLHESYERALMDADGYNENSRDQPTYEDFEIQRADVTDKTVDQLVEADWIQRDGRYQVTYDALFFWSGFAPELVPKDYRDDALTMWIPPVLLDDYSKFSLHPLIPMLPKSEIDELEGGNEYVPEELAPEDGQDIFRIGKGITLDDLNRQKQQPGYSEYTPYGQTEIDPVDYKLVRFYDFATDPKRDENAPRTGRRYVYRVRVALEDPNFPANPLGGNQPPLKTLDPEAYQRVVVLQQRALKDGERDYKRWTEWSKPSDPMSLPSPEQHFTGKVEAKTIRPVQVGNRTVMYERDPPTAKMVISQFSPALKTRIPMRVDVTEGSVLSMEADYVDVIDPITLEIKKYQQLDENGEPIEGKKVGVNSGTTVIDIDGGSKLDIHRADDMTEPGYLLLFDPNGGLSVRGEVEDQQLYRVYSFAEERGE